MFFDGVNLVYSACISSYIWIKFLFCGNLVCSKIVGLLASTQDDPFSDSFSGLEFLGLGDGRKILIKDFFS